jgi:hypothetical protein
VGDREEGGVGGGEGEGEKLVEGGGVTTFRVRGLGGGGEGLDGCSNFYIDEKPLNVLYCLLTILCNQMLINTYILCTLILPTSINDLF